MTMFYNKLKNFFALFLAHFGLIFPILGPKRNFHLNPTLSRTTSHGILASCQNIEKINDIIPRKHSDKWKDGRTEGRAIGRTEG